MEEQVFIEAQGQRISLVGEHGRRIADSPIFKQWLKTVKPESGIVSITEKWLPLSHGAEMRFVGLEIDYRDREGEKHSRIVVLGSNAVAVLVVLISRDTGARSALLVDQLRLPTGGMLLEIPAGIVEDDDDLAETAIREIEEETGLKAQKGDLILLHDPYFSPGRSTEIITLYACEIALSSQEIDEMQERRTGLHEEGEDIRLHLVPLDDLPRSVRDAKSLLAYYCYKDYLVTKRDH